MHKLTDNELMEMVMDKNSQALRVLYKRYNMPVYNFITRYTGNSEIAQEVIQETFTRIWFAAHMFEPAKGSFKSWIYKISLNTAKDEMSKKRYSYKYLNYDEFAETNVTPVYSGEMMPDEYVNQVYVKMEITNALNKLKPFLREVIILKHFHQLKFREIAEITNTSEGTIKARFHNAIIKLNELLKNKEL